MTREQLEAEARRVGVPDPHLLTRGQLIRAIERGADPGAIDTAKALFRGVLGVARSLRRKPPSAPAREAATVPIRPARDVPSTERKTESLRATDDASTEGPEVSDASDVAEASDGPLASTSSDRGDTLVTPSPDSGADDERPSRTSTTRPLRAVKEVDAARILNSPSRPTLDIRPPVMEEASIEPSRGAVLSPPPKPTRPMRKHASRPPSQPAPRMKSDVPPSALRDAEAIAAPAEGSEATEPPAGRVASVPTAVRERTSPAQKVTLPARPASIPPAAGEEAEAARAHALQDEPIPTHTMARLLHDQGHHRRALAILEKLLAEAGANADPELTAEAAMIRKKVGASEVPLTGAALPAESGAELVTMPLPGRRVLLAWGIPQRALDSAQALGARGDLFARAVVVAPSDDGSVSRNTIDTPAEPTGECSIGPLAVGAYVTAAVGFRDGEAFVSVAHAPVLELE